MSPASTSSGCDTASASAPFSASFAMQRTPRGWVVDTEEPCTNPATGAGWRAASPSCAPVVFGGAHSLTGARGVRGSLAAHPLAAHPSCWTHRCEAAPLRLARLTGCSAMARRSSTASHDIGNADGVSAVALGGPTPGMCRRIASVPGRLGGSVKRWNLVKGESMVDAGDSAILAGVRAALADLEAAFVGCPGFDTVDFAFFGARTGWAIVAAGRLEP
eukprot:scaffold24529_cov140-Isochrysis_galbana.AAC.11